MYQTYTPQKNKRLDWYHKWCFFWKGDFGYKYLQIYGNFRVSMFRFWVFHHFAKPKPTPFWRFLKKKTPEVYAFVMLPRWRWNTSTFQARANFLGDTHLQWVGWVESSENAVFLKECEERITPPQKKSNKCPPKMGPQFKRNFQEACLFSVEYIIFTIHLLPEKKKRRTVEKNQWLNHKGRKD